MAPPEALEENGFPSLLQLTETPVFLDRSPTFLTPRTDFVDDFSTDWGWGEGWFQDDSRALHLLCTFFLT